MRAVASGGWAPGAVVEGDGAHLAELLLARELLPALRAEGLPLVGVVEQEVLRPEPAPHGAGLRSRNCTRILSDARAVASASVTAPVFYGNFAKIQWLPTLRYPTLAPLRRIALLN